MKKGIDVSYYQKDIDWARVKAAGIEYAILRVAYGTRIDERFLEYADGAAAFGLPIGVYVCTTATNAAEAVKEVEAAVEELGDRKLVYPFFMDIEADFADGFEKDRLEGILLAFCNAVKSHGYIAGVYASKSTHTSKLRNATLVENGIDVWVAQYNAQQQCTLPYPYAIHQYSSQGKIDGIGSKCVDLNVCYKDYAAPARPEPVTPAAAARRLQIPDNISPAAADAIRADLETYADKLSVLVCLDALQYAYDQTTDREYPIAHYLRGIDLYTPALVIHAMDAAELERAAKAKPEWYPRQTLDMMRRALAWCAAHGEPFCGCDCSGLITGLSRKYGIIAQDADAQADGWCGTSRARQISRKELEPGDYLHRPGHVGLYVGGGYAVEAVGGDFGVQLTVVTDRRATSFLDHTADGKRKIYKPYAWEDFWRPRYKYDITYYRRKTPYTDMPLPTEDTPEGAKEKAFIRWIKGVLRMKNAEVK